MTFLDTVRADREDLARVLKKHRGIRRIVEDLYPDRAHFIYELLQNAEDAGATAARFVLNNDSVSFEHNGRPFTESDIWAITDIGEGTKAGDEDKIGRFGVGFKAVFAYSETPRVWSPTFSFEISGLVLPRAIPEARGLGPQTRFEFPFNNPKKSAAVAFAEVEKGLRELAETTLLFLANLSSISWQIEPDRSGDIHRKRHSENHVEVVRLATGAPADHSHFLIFSDDVKGLAKQKVSVAYSLEYLPGVVRHDPATPLAKQLKIAPASHGLVAVFFPAEKETSGLRFHVHAPFVPELSRASIKETPANDPLFDQLARLAAASLHHIRDLKLLTGEFLGVLPSPRDSLASRYDPIRAAIVEAMNNHPLTPTHSRSHRPAKLLLQAKTSLKDLLSAEDLKFLSGQTGSAKQWAISASQRNSGVDSFLSGLAIQDWDIVHFLHRLRDETHWYNDRPASPFKDWLAKKPVEWQQQLYALLEKEIVPSEHLQCLKELEVVRLDNGAFSLGRRCYFPTDGAEHDQILPRVARGTYTSGTSKPQQEDARRFLEHVGVREVGEAEQIQAILKHRYSRQTQSQDECIYVSDLARFISFVGTDKDRASLFNVAFIFKCADDTWRVPAGVFIDSPVADTGLGAYYGAIGRDAARVVISPRYASMGISFEALARFAVAVGAESKLPIVMSGTRAHPHRDQLYVDYRRFGVRQTDSSIDEDWMVPHLDKVLMKPLESVSRLVWHAMRGAGRNVLKARFRPNRQYTTREVDSSLVLLLRKASWIPQSSGPFVRPSHARQELLPEGFPFDASEKWLEAIHFGEEAQSRSAERQLKQTLAADLGFKDENTLKRSQLFAALPELEQERILSSHAAEKSTELPDREPADSGRRFARVKQQAGDAPEKTAEERKRSVSIGREAVKQETEEYLRDQYTNSDMETICQACKKPLPFKLGDGTYYLEKVEFISDLKRRHRQNYLALCPNHAAMFQHANGSKDAIRKLFGEMEGQQLSVVLAQSEESIYFTKTHIADLRAVIAAEGSVPAA